MVSIFHPAPIASVIGMDAKINFLLPGPLSRSQFVPNPILQNAQPCFHKNHNVQYYEELREKVAIQLSDHRQSLFVMPEHVRDRVSTVI